MESLKNLSKKQSVTLGKFRHSPLWKVISTTNLAEPVPGDNLDREKMQRLVDHPDINVTIKEHK